MIKNNSYNLLVFYFLSVTMQEGYIFFFFLILKATLWKVGIIIIPILLYNIFIARKQDTL